MTPLEVLAQRISEAHHNPVVTDKDVQQATQALDALHQAGYVVVPRGFMEDTQRRLHDLAQTLRELAQ